MNCRARSWARCAWRRRTTSGCPTLAPVLRTFKRSFPDVVLDLRFEDSEVAHELVRHGDCELAVVTLDPGRRARSAVAPGLGRPARLRRGIRTSTGWVEHQGFAGPAVRLPCRSTWHTDLHRPHRARRVRARGPCAESGDVHELPGDDCHACQRRLGWSVLPHTLIDEHLLPLDVDARPLTRTLGTVVHPARSPSNVARAFLQVLQNGSSDTEASQTDERDHQPDPSQ